MFSKSRAYPTGPLSSRQQAGGYSVEKGINYAENLDFVNQPSTATAYLAYLDNILLPAIDSIELDHANEKVVQPELLLCDALAFIGDLPGATFAGYVVSGVASTIGAILTENDFEEGNASQHDYDVTGINWAAGLIPGFGLLPAFEQFGYDAGWWDLYVPDSFFDPYIDFGS
jgi:hypothetical protein